MDLVDEDDGLRAARLTRFARFLHQRPDVLDRGGGGRERDESRPRGLGDDARQRGLPRAGRTPEDHRRDAVALDGVAKKAALAEDLLQPDDVIERGGAEALRQRSIGTGVARDRGERVVVEEGTGHEIQASNEKSRLPPLRTTATGPR